MRSDELRHAARYQWRHILPALGIPAEKLTNKHQPCPVCGDRDRYRFDDKDGYGSYICTHCGNGDGFHLVMHWLDCDYKTAAAAVSDALGIGEGRPAPPAETGANHAATRPNRPPLEHLEQRSATGSRRPVAAYLEGRGLPFPEDVHDLCHHPRLPYWHNGEKLGEYPAMIGRITDSGGRTTGLHLTYTHGGQKLALHHYGERLPAKKMRRRRPRLAGRRCARLPCLAGRHKSRHQKTRSRRRPRPLQREEAGMTNWNKKLGLDDLEAPTDAAYYRADEGGTCWITYDEEGKEQRDHLADAIHLIGRAVDEEGGNWRIIEWRDRYHTTHHAALDMGDIGTPAGWRALQRLGIAIKAGRKKRERLADYLQGSGKNTRWQLAKTAGWHSGAYILPSGEVLGAAENIHYHGDTSQGADYQPKGSLADWQALARLAEDNSRLCLALGCAFAAPLLDLLGHESGGFHLYGDSSDGKTTAALFTLSVWGNPKELKLTWEGTAHGFSNTAAARNDGLLVLDEIGQASARTAAQTAYAVLNGTGKIQGAKEGGNRAINRWRIMLLSTGEKNLDGYLKTEGKDWQAGQATRLPAIPADTGKGMGIYDTLHGFAGGAELSEHLTREGEKNHGTAGRAYIAHLATIDAVGEARKHIDAFMDAIQGSGKHEDRKIIEQAEDFLQTWGMTNRFAWRTWRGGEGDPQTYSDHAGYKEAIGDQMKFWITPAVFRGEIARGYEANKACQVLHAIGWLQPKAPGRWQHQLKGKGRYYILIGIEPPGEEDA